MQKNSLRLSGFVIHHDLGAFYSRHSEIGRAEEIIKREIGRISYLNLQQMGYQDIQMLNAKFGIPCFSFGPKGGNRHQAGEWVDVKSLQRTETLYKNLIKEYCQF